MASATSAVRADARLAASRTASDRRTGSAQPGCAPRLVRVLGIAIVFVFVDVGVGPQSAWVVKGAAQRQVGRVAADAVGQTCTRHGWSPCGQRVPCARGTW